MAALLDTSVAILLRDAQTEADSRMKGLAAVPALSIVTQVELEGGVRVKPELAPARRAALDLLLATLTVLPFNRDCVEAYRRIVETAGFSRRKIIDRMIAATALAHGLTLITLHGPDFSDIPGLSYEVWPSP